MKLTDQDYEKDNLLPIYNSVESKTNDDNDKMIFDRKYLFFIIPLDWILTPPTGSYQIKNSPNLTIFLLLNSMIGSGILAQAYVFSQAGWISTIIEYFIIGYLTYLGIHILIESAEIIGKFSYSELTVEAIGEIGKPLVEGSIAINAAGALLSYIIIIGSLLDSIFMTYISSSEWYINTTFLIVASVSLFVAPLCLIRNFGHLAFVSIISIIAVSSVVLLVIIGGPLTSNAFKMPLKKGSLHGSLKTIGSVIFSFSYAPAVFHSYKSLYPRKPYIFDDIAQSTTIIGVFLCFSLGLTGYWSFRGNTESDILENFSGNLGAIFKIIIIIHLLLYIPGDFVIMRSSILNTFNLDVTTISDTLYIILTLVSLAFITIFACLLLNINSESITLSIVLDITGGISGSLTSFTIPGLIGLKLLWHDPTKRWKSLLLLCFGAIIPFLVVYGEFLSF